MIEALIPLCIPLSSVYIRGQHTFSIKGYVNTLGFVNHIVSVTTANSVKEVKAGLDNMGMTGNDFVQKKKKKKVSNKEL